MIPRYSPLFERGTPQGAAANEDRARVLVDLCGHRIPIGDMALSVNCDETLVRALLATQHRSVSPGADSVPVNFSPISKLRLGQHSKAALTPMEQDALNQEERALLLGREIRQWLIGFEAGEQDFQLAMEHALGLLDQGPFDLTGRYKFEVWTVAHEVWSLWERPVLKPGERELAVVIGRWLAAWIRFWVFDRAVWERALGIAYAGFLESALAA